jgi:hypothetical protein
MTTSDYSEHFEERVDGRSKSNGVGGGGQLANMVAIFRECLALKNDNAVYVTIGTVAANLLNGRDPLWLGLIGPPSSAKTELLNSLSRLPYVHAVETFSPAGLLSGTPKGQKESGATGGTLREIGAFGIMLFMDFGSVLELRAEQRAEMMAAMRRIYDGHYTRRIGTGGGRTLEWRGKAGCLFGATQAYDVHHSVAGALGDRFLLFRVETLVEGQLDKCSPEHIGESRNIRKRLAEAVANLFASLPEPLPDPELMTNEEYAELRKVIRIVIKLRAGVMRDRIKREIDDVLDPEGPARLILSLQQLFAGLLLIGLNRAKATDIIHQIAYDSAPKIRLKAMKALTSTWQTTRIIANNIDLPTSTTKRALEDLFVHHLALRDQDENEDDEDENHDLVGGKKKKKRKGGAYVWKSV